MEHAWCRLRLFFFGGGFTLKLRITAGVFVSFCFTVLVMAEPKLATLEAELNARVPDLLKIHKVPGVAIGVIENGSVTAQFYYGLSDKLNSTPVTHQTSFNVGSVSKTLTAWAVMRLVESGKVNLDSPIQNYLSLWQLPASKYEVSGVTVRRLLNHTSGIGQWAVPQFEPGEQIPSLAAVLSSGQNHQGEKAEMIFEPGTEWRYSGGGYTMLQLMIEEVSGDTFSEFMQREIFAPLGMNNSGFTLTEDLLSASATAYDHQGKETPLARFSATGAAGLHTTVGDLAKFASASLSSANGGAPGRGIITPETVAMMTSNGVSAASSDPTVVNRNYGLGYFVSGGIPSFVGHGGDNRGWHARFILYPDTNNGFVALTNSSNGFPLAETINCLMTNQLANIPAKKVCD